MSVNSGTDKSASDEYYPTPELPTLYTISDDIQCLRSSKPLKELFGCTADVAQAYCQNTASVESAKLRCTWMAHEGRAGGIFGYMDCLYLR